MRAYHRPRAVAVGKHNYTVLFGNCAYKVAFFLIFKDSKPVGGYYNGVNNIFEGDFIVLTLNNYRLSDLNQPTHPL